MYQKNMARLAIRYEDLLADRESIITSIFKYCGLPIAEVSNACSVFNKDAQKGSNLSQETTRNNKINEPDILEIRHKIAKLLEKHPQIKTSDFIVPGTL